MSFCSVFLTAMTSSDFRTTDSPGPELVCRYLLSDDRHREFGTRISQYNTHFYPIYAPRNTLAAREMQQLLIDLL